MSIQRPQIRWRAGSGALLVAGAGAGAAVVLVVAIVVRLGTSPSSRASPSPSESFAVPASNASPPFASAAIGRVFTSRLPSGEFAVARVGGPSLRIPPQEVVLAVSDDQVASVMPTGPAGSTLVIRDLASGRELVRLMRPEQVSTGVFAGGSLYFTGAMTDWSDSGVSAIDLANLPVREVIASAPWPADWGGDGSGIRNALAVSPTGRTIGAPACGPVLVAPQRCFVDVIDVASGSVTRPVSDTPLYLWDMSDTMLFAVPEERLFVVALDRKTGERQWQSGGRGVSRRLSDLRRVSSRRVVSRRRGRRTSGLVGAWHHRCRHRRYPGDL